MPVCTVRAGLAAGTIVASEPESITRLGIGQVFGLDDAPFRPAGATQPGDPKRLAFQSEIKRDEQCQQCAGKAKSSAFAKRREHAEHNYGSDSGEPQPMPQQP